MSTTLKLRRGTTAQHASFTGAEGEITVDTDKDTLVVHDGSTAGGIPVMSTKSAQTLEVTDNSNAALRITQLGTGNALVVESAANTAALLVGSDGITRFGNTSATNQSILQVIPTTGSDVTIRTNRTGTGVSHVPLYLQGGTGDPVQVSTTGGLIVPRTAVTSPASTDGNVFSGTYTPTLTNSTNVAASTAFECFYMRVGNVVTVSGQVSIDVTTTLTDSVLLMTLPVASTFTVARNCGGTGASSTAGVYGTETIAISGNVANGAAEFRLRPVSVSNLDYRFSFSYRVL